MKALFKWNSRIGTFYIAQSRDGKFHPAYDNQSLGSYSQPWQATEDLAEGQSFSISSGIDTSNQGIPVHHSDWEIA